MGLGTWKDFFKVNTFKIENIKKHLQVSLHKNLLVTKQIELFEDSYLGA